MTKQSTTERQQTQAAASAVVAKPPDAQTNAVQRVRGLLELRQDELSHGLSTFGIPVDRFMSVALAQFSRRPELWACEPLSVYRAMKEAADYGLEPTGAIGGAHLVPYGNQCTLLIDYRGWVRMVRRSGEVTRVEARVVREQDAFDYAYGLEPYLTHRPALLEDPGPLAFAYAVLIFRDGERQFDVMSAAEIEAIRGRSRAGRSGPWVTDYFEMAKKTVLRRLLKLGPLDEITRTALVAEDERDGATQPHVLDAGQPANRQAQLRQQLANRLAPGVIDEPEQVPDVVPGQLAAFDESSTSVDEAVDKPEPTGDIKPVKTSHSVDEQAGTHTVCGATVAGPGRSHFTCHIDAGHRGDHSDGQHDWPEPQS